MFVLFADDVRMTVRFLSQLANSTIYIIFIHSERFLDGERTVIFNHVIRCRLLISILWSLVEEMKPCKGKFCPNYLLETRLVHWLVSKNERKMILRRIVYQGQALRWLSMCFN